MVLKQVEITVNSLTCLKNIITIPINNIVILIDPTVSRAAAILALEE